MPRERLHLFRIDEPILGYRVEHGVFDNHEYGRNSGMTRVRSGLAGKNWAMRMANQQVVRFALMALLTSGLLACRSTSTPKAGVLGPGSRTSAKAAYDAGDYVECARIYAVLAESSPRMVRRRHLVNRAGCLARAGAPDRAFEALEAAVDSGLATIQPLEKDGDLASLREDDRWTGLVASVKKAAARRDRSLTDPDLRTALLKRQREDQAALMKAYVDKQTKGDPDAVAAAKAMTARNTAWIKDVVTRLGWPHHGMVGEDGAHAAWLLVQHADEDPTFQAKCLALMAALVEREQVSEIDYAYLYDRVAVAQSRPQRYGTQFDETRRPRPIEDPDNVDARRIRIGLSTLAEYEQMMTEMYGPPPAQP